MAKRRLSRQQIDRIARNQESDAEVNGVVISHFGKQLDVESLVDGAIVRCHQRANLPTLVTGDRVVWEPGDDGVGVIVSLAERRSVFARPGFAGVVKPMAANIDVVLVVIAPTPMPHANLIDRYLVAIETLGLRPMLILNKADLLQSCEDPLAIDELLEIYRNIDYSVLEVSATGQQGLDALRQALAGSTTVLVGQSGVGKSSLVNGLGVDAELALVGGLSTVHDKGMHTTTTSRLFHLEGFDLIDSPWHSRIWLGSRKPPRRL
jgi:ribosome biogenesis GTPase